MCTRSCDDDTFRVSEQRALFDRAVMMVIRCVDQLYACTSRVHPEFDAHARRTLPPEAIAVQLYRGLGYTSRCGHGLPAQCCCR